MYQLPRNRTTGELKRSINQAIGRQVGGSGQFSTGLALQPLKALNAGSNGR